MSLSLHDFYSKIVKKTKEYNHYIFTHNDVIYDILECVIDDKIFINSIYDRSETFGSGYQVSGFYCSFDEFNEILNNPSIAYLDN
jgi:hypothetical protein